MWNYVVINSGEERKKKNQKDDSQIVRAAGCAFVNRYL